MTGVRGECPCVEFLEDMTRIVEIIEREGIDAPEWAERFMIGRKMMDDSILV